VFHRINLWDDLSFEPTGGDIVLTSDSSAVPLDERNLCWKAASALKARFDVAAGVSINLTKRIPIGSGLGGGSSDAAAVLLSLPPMWNINPSEHDLSEIASKIGSDVPYFLKRESAYAVGRGEILTHVNMQVPYWIVVVSPPIHVSTPWAYAEFSKTLPLQRAMRNGLPMINGNSNPAEFAMLLKNDFEDVVFAAYPAVRVIKDRLLTSGAAFALMSGSGSSVFGLFAEEIAARSAAALFEPPDCISITPPFFVPA
jgi:4-diphosphocytidyl-2-C-methyl-D-erythritol kinase